MRRIQVTVLSLAGLMVVAAFGCASGGEETGADSAPDTAPGVPTFADLQYIFDRNCTLLATDYPRWRTRLKR